jgi:hypothetical protein
MLPDPTLPTAATPHGGRVLAAHLLALCLGIAAFFLILGLSTLLNQAPFLATPTGDFAAEQASYFLVAQDVWRFPFLALPNVNMPEGANAVFFGGTPLLALVARIWGQLFGTVPNLMGFWYLLCYALQAHAFFYLMRQITGRRPMLVALCSIVGVLTYAFLMRFGHVSLFGQFFVIYAMGLVLAALRPDRRWEVALAILAALAVAAMLIFAYLAVSMAMLFGAALAALWWKGRMRFPQVMLWGSGFAALLLLVAWSSGYFWAAARAEPTDMSSYAQLGLNIGGLFIPPQSMIFPGHALLRSWWEGDFYLGLGTLLLLALVIVLRPRVVWQGLVRYWPLVLVLGLLTLYSLSNRWAFGETVLFEYRLPAWALPIVGLARSGGRLFWPIGYLIIALAFALAIQHLGRRGIVAVALALVLVVVESLAPIAYERRTAFEQAPFPLDYAGLQTVMDAHRTLRLYPSFWCDPGSEGSNRRVVHWQLQFASARANQTSNSAITVRRMKDCAQESAAMPSELLRPGELDVFTGRTAFHTAFAGREAEAEAHCREFALRPATGYMCSRDWMRGTAVPIRELFPLNRSATVVQTVDFSANGDWKKFVRSGWGSSSDGEFTWTEGMESGIDLLLPEAAAGTTRVLRFEVYPFLPGAIPLRRVTVLAGDTVLTTWRIGAEGWNSWDVPVPPLPPGTPLRLTLRQEDTRSPRELGVGADPRHLALAVRRIEVVELPR